MDMNYYYVKIIYACVRLRKNENICVKVMRYSYCLKNIFNKNGKT